MLAEIYYTIVWLFQSLLKSCLSSMYIDQCRLELMHNYSGKQRNLDCSVLVFSMRHS